MELIIKDRLQNQLRNCYVIEVEFMFGDVDGFETLTFEFSKEKYKQEEFRKEAHNFIKSIQEAIQLDRRGRGGFDSYKEVIDWYGLGKDRVWRNSSIVNKVVYKPVHMWANFCEEGINEEIIKSEEFNENSEFFYSIPTYESQWYASYHGIDIYYYDNDGYKYNVEINEKN